MTTPDQILAAVESATGASAAEIKADSRTARVSTARFLAMRLYHETHPWASNHDAALAVGKKDPSTGRHGLMRAAHLLQHDEAFQLAHKRATEALRA